MHKSTTVFILEGAFKEDFIVNRMTNCFFGNTQNVIINLPAQMNIYMLYQELKKYDFEVDIIELLRSEILSVRDTIKDIKRQQIDQIFLFFDYDPHQNNLPNDVDPEEVMNELLDCYCEETDQGKLYISYSMSEALYDFKEGLCQAYTNCLLKSDEVCNYKKLVGECNPLNNSHLNYTFWENALNSYGLRIRCLFNFASLNYDEYTLNITPKSIFKEEIELSKSKGKIFVLSAFPEFLLEYFRVDFWNKYFKRKKYKFDSCVKGY